MTSAGGWITTTMVATECPNVTELFSLLLQTKETGKLYDLSPLKNENVTVPCEPMLSVGSQ